MHARRSARSGAFEAGMPRPWLLCTALAVAVGLTGSLTVGDAPVRAADTGSITDGMQSREVLGLRSDRDYVADLVGTAADVGSERFGIPMTSAEFDDVDLDGRILFSNRVHRDVMPWVEEQPEFAGSWIDQKHDGKFVIQLTKARDPLIEGIGSRMPKVSRGWRVEGVDHSWTELETAVHRAPEVSREVDADGRLVLWGIDSRHNRVRLVYTLSTVEQMRSRKDELVSRLGVPVVIQSGEAPVDLDTSDLCSNGGSRNNCWDPILAGVRIYKDSVGHWDCTMGWHVYKESAEHKNQWLTAAHCVDPNVSPGTIDVTKMYHSSYFHGGHYVGILRAKLTGQDMDIARVGHQFASEATDRVFGHGANAVVHLHQHTKLSVNDPIMFSGATSGQLDGDGTVGGLVSIPYDCWDSNYLGIEVCGGAGTGMHGKSGDSGGPVYRKWMDDGVAHIRPIGILDASWQDGNVWTVRFALLKDAFAEWNGWEVRGANWP